MSLEQIWSDYKRNRDDDLYTDNASVVFIPTAAGARGYDAVRQFLAKAYDPRVLKISERAIYTTIGSDSIVEEAETSITFVSGDGSWVVPGIDSRHTIDNRVIIPMVGLLTIDACENMKISVGFSISTLYMILIKRLHACFVYTLYI